MWVVHARHLPLGYLTENKTKTIYIYSPNSACTTEGFLLGLYSNSPGIQDCWWSACRPPVDQLPIAWNSGLLVVSL